MDNLYTPEMHALSIVMVKMAVGDTWETQNMTSQQAKKVADDLAGVLGLRSFITKQENGQRIIVRIK